MFTCEIQEQEAKKALLIEHQSKPDRYLAFRVYHYLFGMLFNTLKSQPNRALPAAYVMVFYHGEQSPYPYSLKLEDCFSDPLGLMAGVFNKAIPLVDVNQLSDEALKQQSWVGPMARALKHIRDRDLSETLLELLEDIQQLEHDDGNVLSWSLSELC